MPRRIGDRHSSATRRKRQDLERAAAVLGISGDESIEVLAAWELRRDAMLARSQPGSRPEEWWAFEQGLERPEDIEQEAAALAELGELRDDERDLILATADQRLAEYPAKWMPLPPVVESSEIVEANNLRRVLGMPRIREQDFEARLAAWEAADEARRAADDA